jgi:hypothetical protein
MKVTLQFEGKSITVSTSSGFKLLVDDEVLLDHAGEVKCDSPKACCFGSCHGTSSLFEHAEAEADEDIEYINFAVPNSSFIETIRWWSYEEALGENSLEVHFKDGNYACYSDVPKYLIEQWIGEIKAGGSAGKFFNYNIKDEYESIMES